MGEGGIGTTGGREQVISPTESVVSRVEQNPSTSKPSLEIPNLEGKDFPKLVQDDFPALPGGGALSNPALMLPSAWSRAVVKSSDSDGGAEKLIAKNSDSEENNDNSNISEENVKEDNKEDSNACDFEAVIDSTVPSDSVCIDIEDPSNNIENIDDEKGEEGASVKKDNEAEEEVTASEMSNIDNIEVVTNEDEFNRRKADNS